MQQRHTCDNLGAVDVGNLILLIGAVVLAAVGVVLIVKDRSSIGLWFGVVGMICVTISQVISLRS